MFMSTMNEFLKFCPRICLRSISVRPFRPYFEERIFAVLSITFTNSEVWTVEIFTFLLESRMNVFSFSTTSGYPCYVPKKEIITQEWVKFFRLQR